MIEVVRRDRIGIEDPDGRRRPDPERDRTYFCNICSHEWTVELRPAGRFASIEEVVQRTGLRRDELTTLADIGALNAFTNERRSALWQVERAVRPAGELFAGEDDNAQRPTPELPRARTSPSDPNPSPKSRCEPWMTTSACRPTTPAWA